MQPLKLLLNGNDNSTFGMLSPSQCSGRIGGLNFADESNSWLVTRQIVGGKCSYIVNWDEINE